MTFFLKIFSKNVILFIILFCMSNNDIVGMEPNESTNDKLCKTMKERYWQERVKFFDTDYNKLLTDIYIHCIKGKPRSDFDGKWPLVPFKNRSHWINHNHISDIIDMVNEGKKECLNLFYSFMSKHSANVPESIFSFFDQAFYLSYFDIIVKPIKCESNPQTDMPTQKGNLDNQRVEQSKSQKHQKAKEKQEGEWKRLISFIASNEAMFKHGEGLRMAFELFQFFKDKKDALIGFGLPAIGKYEYKISLRNQPLNLNKTDKGKALLEKKDFITLITIMGYFLLNQTTK